MAVRDKDVAICRHGHAGRPIERIRTGPGHTLLAERHQDLAIGTQLEHFLAHDHAGRVPGGHAEDRLLVVDVGHPQVSISVDGEPVVVGKQPRAKALQKLSRRIEFQNRRIRRTPADAGGLARRHDVEASMKDPDVALGVHVHADHFAPVASVHALGKRRPAFDEAIRIGQFGRLGVGRGLRTRQPTTREDRRKRDRRPDRRSTCSCHRPPPRMIHLALILPAT